MYCRRTASEVRAYTMKHCTFGTLFKRQISKLDNNIRYKSCSVTSTVVRTLHGSCGITSTATCHFPRNKSTGVDSTLWHSQINSPKIIVRSVIKILNRTNEACLIKSRLTLDWQCVRTLITIMNCFAVGLRQLLFLSSVAKTRKNNYSHNSTAGKRRRGDCVYNNLYDATVRRLHAGKGG
jgi:CxxC motif-containing protein